MLRSKQASRVWGNSGADARVKLYQQRHFIGNYLRMLQLSLSRKQFSAIGAIAAFAIAMPVRAVEPDRSPTHNTFTQWCQNQSKLPLETQHTIEMLLQKAGTNNCAAADAKLSELTELMLFRRQISDLRPIASFTNLQQLWLYKNHITDISPLASLTNLNKLWIYDNRVTDITPLSSLTGLIVLSLDDNQIEDVMPLVSLSNLAVLNLAANKIADIKPLEALTNLQYLNLKGNPIEWDKDADQWCPAEPLLNCYF
jgi:internalin A